MTDDEAKQYMRDGYAVIRNLLTAAELDALVAESVSLLRGRRGEIEGLEPPPDDVPDSEVLRGLTGLYFPHKISELLAEIMAHPGVVDALRRVIGPNVKCIQSMLFIKPPGQPGQAWHQDEVPIPSRDHSLTGVWIALDSATVENGCLWVIPGSQRPGILYERGEHDDKRFDGVHQSMDIPYTDDDAMAVEVDPGDAIVFDGYLLHRSLNNRTTDQWRRALVYHYMSAESWHGPNNSARDIVIVCGDDPYAKKGITDTHKAAVRR